MSFGPYRPWLDSLEMKDPLAAILAQTLGTGRQDFADNALTTVDGSVLRWTRLEHAQRSRTGTGDGLPLTVEVSPVRPGQAVTVEYRENGGPVRERVAQPEPRASSPNARRFIAQLPELAEGVVEFLPVLRMAGRPVSPRLSETRRPPRLSSAPATRAQTAPVAPHAPPHAGPGPRWSWQTQYLASLKAKVEEQPVGRMPDGLRINWEVESGTVAGPHFSGTILHGTGDWMRIREDGVAIVDVRACLGTNDGARISVTYGGFLDLGPDGFTKALHGAFVPLPPLVVTPVFETSEPRYAWLNRARCVGVGRVDTAALTYDFDVYTIEVGARTHAG